MKHLLAHTPTNALEQAAADLASGHPDALDAFERLARRTRLSPKKIAAGRGNAFEGVGTIDTRVVVLALPTAVAAALLPAGLELAPQPITFPDKHPVFFLFSHDVFDAWFGDMDYQEMMVGVPYVQLSDPHAPNRGPFIYMPRLYLNDKLPCELGNHLYGFEKVEADIENTASTYTVTGKEGLIAKAKFKATGDWGPVSSIRNFDTMRKMFAQPTVSQALRIVDPNAFNVRDVVSPFLCTTITYAFESHQTQIQPIEAELSLTGQLTPDAVPAGTYKRPSLSVDPLGSFRLKAGQVVSLPGSCARTRYTGLPSRRRQRVVVLGGGPSACAAAYYLAKQSDRYEVEMYTMGWRLGGKCAAGRNQAARDRIEEHGLHAFVGFYENAIRTMREVYADAGLEIARGKPPYRYDKGEGPVAGAFLGVKNVGVMSNANVTGWKYFATPQQPNHRIPGQIPEDGQDSPRHFGHAITGALRSVMSDIESLLGFTGKQSRALDAGLEKHRKHPKWRELIEHLEGKLVDAVDLGEGTIRSIIDRVVHFLETMAIDRIAHDIEQGTRLFDGLAWILDKLRKALRVVLAKPIKEHGETWFIWAGIDTVLTAVIGLIDERVVDFRKLDDRDFREWLLANGLDKRNAQIAAINQVYETMFAHGANKPVPDAMAAGVALRWFVLVSFMYSGYPAYEFKYSCPQTMLTPYYLALEKLGAKVHFFHRVESLDIKGSGDARTLSGIRMQVQATVRDGVDKYDPFLRLPGNPDEQPAWPNKPDLRQLAQGRELHDRDIDLEDVWSDWEGAGSKVLEQGKDFDLCVLGIPITAMRHIAEPLTKPKSKSYCKEWKDMMEQIKVTRTLSAQIWFTPCAADLMVQADKIGMLTCYEPPEPSYANFKHLTEWEGWGKDERPKTLAYHTGSDVAISVAAGYPAKKPTDNWPSEFEQWLETHYAGFYNKVKSYDALLDAMATPYPAKGSARLRAQYFNKSVQPSDLYVLSQPKAMKARLGQSESRVHHLFLCGDWTTTDLNCGCVEASTQSGMLAARVISNTPTYIWRTGF